MTIQKAISRADVYRPNRIDMPTKVDWIAELEAHIYDEIIGTHEGKTRPMIRCEMERNPDYALVAPYPYDGVYANYLACNIDLASNDIAKYNNDRLIYLDSMMALRDHWNRIHMPKQNVTAIKPWRR